MNVVTADEIRELDRRAIEEAGIPGVVLMENAGRAVVDQIERRYGPLAGKVVAVFCGGGNNGGDGFVIVRLLLLAGARVDLFCSQETLSGKISKLDAGSHFKVTQFGAGYRLQDLPTNAGTGEASSEWSGRFDLAVDALLGTGIQSAPRDWYADAIRALNELKCPVIAVDIPSGIDADSGAVRGEAVRATDTVTFAYPKLGLFLAPGYENVGSLQVADIGFPWQSLQPSSGIELLACYPGSRCDGIDCSPSLRQPIGWELLLRRRRPESNKGDYGHVGIVAGSRTMAGAPALVARAAQRAGAGLVTVLTGETTQPILAAKLDEQMTLPLPEADGAIAESAWERIEAFMTRATALCVGPGLSTHRETVRLVHRIVREADIPLVLDADGLNALAMEPTTAKERSAVLHSPLVITPHPGEAARLLGTSIAEVQSNRIASVRELAARFQSISVLKGRHTLIADPAGRVCINASGNPGMATGGMGDSLTGIIGALLAMNAVLAKRGDSGASAMFAACLGVHLHGIAGDLAAKERGGAGLIAGDVIDCLPRAWSVVTQSA